jgi:hypothetical protein
MTAFWDVLTWRLVEADRHESSAYCLHLQDPEADPSTTLHGATSHKAVIFILAAVETLRFKEKVLQLHTHYPIKLYSQKCIYESSSQGKWESCGLQKHSKIC